MFGQLEFRRARLWVRLGCGADERAKPQAVDLDLAVRFAVPPRACSSDALADTVCYADLIALARAHTAEREFHLVEFLAHELRAVLAPVLPDRTRFWLRVTKLNPPIEELAGGVAFALGDFDPAIS